jgi:hypothetical protein
MQQQECGAGSIDLTHMYGGVPYVNLVATTPHTVTPYARQPDCLNSKCLFDFLHHRPQGGARPSHRRAPGGDPVRFHLVQAYLRKTGQTAAEATLIPSAEMVRVADFV